MPVPDIEVFNEFLASLSLQRLGPDSESERLEAVPRRALYNLSEHSSSDPLYLWYRRTCTLTPSGMIERLRKEFQHVGHAPAPEIAMTMLAAFCLMPANLGSPVQRLNTILDEIRSANVSQFWIAPYPPLDSLQAFRLERFTVGPLDRKKLVYRCNKIGCDYFDRYPHQFSNKFAIEGAPIPVQVLDWV